MSDQKSDKSKSKRYIGKMKGINTKYGPLYKIYMDNFNHTNNDGTPNKFFKGLLVWMDIETGLKYQVKQMTLWIPKEGMRPENLAQGFTHFITITLEDDYEVTVIG
jgi:hypothetical protein